MTRLLLILVLLFGARPARGQPIVVGDCNGDGMVRVNEVITCINIDLGMAPLDQCPACDCTGMAVDTIPIQCPIQAVLNLLYPPDIKKLCGVGCSGHPPSATCADGSCFEYFMCGTKGGTDLCMHTDAQFRYCLGVLCPGGVLP